MNINLFKWIASGIFSIFMGTIIFAIVIAYGRTSSRLGMDMANIQKIRYEAQKK